MSWVVQAAGQGWARWELAVYAGDPRQVDLAQVGMAEDQRSRRASAEARVARDTAKERAEVDRLEALLAKAREAVTRADAALDEAALAVRRSTRN